VTSEKKPKPNTKTGPGKLALQGKIENAEGKHLSNMERQIEV